MVINFIVLAGRTTTNEELEEMLEQGNSAVFTQGVSVVGIAYLRTISKYNFCTDYDGDAAS